MAQLTRRASARFSKPGAPPTPPKDGESLNTNLAHPMQSQRMAGESGRFSSISGQERRRSRIPRPSSIVSLKSVKGSIRDNAKLIGSKIPRLSLNKPLPTLPQVSLQSQSSPAMKGTMSFFHQTHSKDQAHPSFSSSTRSSLRSVIIPVPVHPTSSCGVSLETENKKPDCTMNRVRLDCQSISDSNSSTPSRSSSMFQNASMTPSQLSRTAQEGAILQDHRPIWSISPPPSMSSSRNCPQGSRCRRVRTSWQLSASTPSDALDVGPMLRIDNEADCVLLGNCGKGESDKAKVQVGGNAANKGAAAGNDHNTAHVGHCGGRNAAYDVASVDLIDLYDEDMRTSTPKLGNNMRNVTGNLNGHSNSTSSSDSAPRRVTSMPQKTAVRVSDEMASPEGNSFIRIASDSTIAENSLVGKLGGSGCAVPSPSHVCDEQCASVHGKVPITEEAKERFYSEFLSRAKKLRRRSGFYIHKNMDGAASTVTYDGVSFDIVTGPAPPATPPPSPPNERPEDVIQKRVQDLVQHAANKPSPKSSWPLRSSSIVTLARGLTGSRIPTASSLHAPKNSCNISNTNPHGPKLNGARANSNGTMLIHPVVGKTIASSTPATPRTPRFSSVNPTNTPSKIPKPSLFSRLIFKLNKSTKAPTAQNPAGKSKPCKPVKISSPTALDAPAPPSSWNDSLVDHLTSPNNAIRTARTVAHEISNILTSLPGTPDRLHLTLGLKYLEDGITQTATALMAVEAARAQAKRAEAAYELANCALDRCVGAVGLLVPKRRGLRERFGGH